MAPNKPKPRMAPAVNVLAAHQEAAARLLALDDWTEVPNNPPAAGVAATVQIPAPVQPIAAAVPAKPEVKKMPWEDVSTTGVISFNFKLPAKLAAKLKYVGDTEYGETMTSILVAALEPKLDAILKGRGLK